MSADLGGKSTFPKIVPTALRPDIILRSQNKRSLLWRFNTVPSEESCDEANARKRTKYDELLAAIAECRLQSERMADMELPCGNKMRRLPSPIYEENVQHTWHNRKNQKISNSDAMLPAAENVDEE